MKAMKRAGTIVISVILWAIILLAALYAFTTMATKDDQNVASILGYTPLVVETDSMKPTFESGDLIFIKKCDTSKLNEGDIITFHTIIDNQYALNTHRIQKIDEANGVRSYTTIGDNNNGIADQHVISDGDIVGKYIGHVSGLGKVMNFLSSSMGFLIVIVLPMLLFFIYQVYNLIMISIRLKKAMAVENAEEIANARIQQEKADQAADEAARAKDEAQAALEEAKRLKEEAEALKAKAEKELKEARKDED
jgi:signal peptidase